MTATADLGHIVEGLRGLAVPIGEVHADPANARTGHAVDRIAASLRQYGQRKPIVANRREGGKVEAGNGTLAAALSLGWGHVAVVWVDEDSAAAAGFGIADNRVGDLSDWDLDKLTDSIEVSGDMFTAFEIYELDELLDDLGRTNLQDASGGRGSGTRKLGDAGAQIKPVLYVDQVAVFEAAIRRTGLLNRGDAIVTICRAYLELRGDE